MEKKTVEEKETLFIEYLQKPPYPIDDMIALIADVPASKAEEWTALSLTAFAEAQDFTSAFRLVRARSEALEQKLQGGAVRDALRKTTRDRLLVAFIDSVGFDKRPLKDALDRLERLLQIQARPFVLSEAWGLGEARRFDYFYRRITVDFPHRKGHQFTFDAACETLVPAPDSHILMVAKGDPDCLAKWIKEEPGRFVKEMLKSFGDMPITRLEELSAKHGFVKTDGWKAFWERARTDLRKDKLVEIPTRRAEPLHLKESAEKYGAEWLGKFQGIKDPKSILSSVRELQAAARSADADAAAEAGSEALKLDEDTRAKLAARLAFALKGARGVDDALYARLAFCMDELKLDPACVSKARSYLWEGNRYLDAAAKLPARDVETFVKFLTAENGDSTKKALFAAMPEMCFPLLSATLTVFAKDADCEKACAALLRDPAAPATLVTYVLARHEHFAEWKELPGLVVVLTHAIAIGEGRQSGETLRMQNTIRRLFADKKWLEGVMNRLDPSDRAIFFERFQASAAWDPATHHRIMTSMMDLAPELKARRVKREAPQKVDRITSIRSYAERTAAYQRLVNVDIPKNARDIDAARSLGDLRENFEYQSAKDEQRALLQRQTQMQEELNAVKAVDFSTVTTTDSVCPGTTVTILTAAGERVAYTILGEWDNDLSRNIISNKTRLSQNLLGKKVGEQFDLPDSEGGVSAATVEAIEPLSEELRAWVKATPEAGN